MLNVLNDKSLKVFMTTTLWYFISLLCTPHTHSDDEVKSHSHTRFSLYTFYYYIIFCRFALFWLFPSWCTLGNNVKSFFKYTIPFHFLHRHRYLWKIHLSYFIYFYLEPTRRNPLEKSTFIFLFSSLPRFRYNTVLFVEICIFCDTLCFIPSNWLL